MTITISPELGFRLRDRAAAEGLSVEAYLEQLIHDDWMEVDNAPLAESDPEFPETRAAVREGLEQIDRGECRPARAVFAELRAKNGVPR